MSLNESPQKLYNVGLNYKKADITDRQKAMLDFAIKTCNRSQDIVKDDFTILHQHDFSDDDIWDIAAITGLFALSNRMASLTSMRPNAEFYALGRDFPVADP